MRRLALAIALLAAGTDDDGGSGPIPIDGLQNALVNTFCNVYVNCGLIDDVATCRMLDIDLEIDKNVIAAVEAGKVIYHGDNARACLAALSGAGCEVNALNRSDNAAVCDLMFEGTVAADGQCAIDEECLSQQCNVTSCPDACCQGTCFGDAPPPRPRVGESCAMSFDCIDSFCDSTSRICTAYRQLGAPCTSDSECAAGACVVDVCTALPGPGEACTPSTSDPGCSHVGYVCSATTSTCVQFGLTGDTCATTRDCSPIYNCNTAGNCELRPTIGDPCNDTTSAGLCIDTSYCEPTSQICTAPKADGAMCAGSEECRSGECDFNTSTCITPPICI